MVEKVLILIPCSKSKKSGGAPFYERANCIVNYLSQSAERRLIELRRRVAVALRETLGPDVGVETTETQIKFMRAYDRYSGNLYSKISKSAWEKLNRSQNLGLVIVSALYGILKHNELIRDYNRAMDRDKVEGVLLKTWWNTQGLHEILLDYIADNEIKVVHDFLSKNYSEAIWPLQSRAEELGIEYVKHGYSGFGSGSNCRRGEDVERLIKTFDI